MYLDVTILTKYPPLREDSDGKFPFFLQNLPPGEAYCIGPILIGALLVLMWGKKFKSHLC